MTPGSAQRMRVAWHPSGDSLAVPYVAQRTELVVGAAHDHRRLSGDGGGLCLAVACASRAAAAAAVIADRLLPLLGLSPLPAHPLASSVCPRFFGFRALARRRRPRLACVRVCGRRHGSGVQILERGTWSSDKTLIGGHSKDVRTDRQPPPPPRALSHLLLAASLVARRPQVAQWTSNRPLACPLSTPVSGSPTPTGQFDRVEQEWAVPRHRGPRPPDLRLAALDQPGH